ncbi:MAG: hypothetical protein OWS74_02560, partial [Firmicutes bacterium]|nr:hypothetical protein [Bacillota bacterium]
MSLALLMPEVVVLAVMGLILAATLLLPQWKELPYILSVLGLAGALGSSVRLWAVLDTAKRFLLDHSLVVNSYSVMIALLALFSGVITILLAWRPAR